MEILKPLSEKTILQELEKRLSNRDWRISNLYHIQDKKGNLIKFKPNLVQQEFNSSLWFLNIILKSRQHGISTNIEMLIADTCIFNSNTTAGIIADTLPNAIGLLKKISIAYENLPNEIKDIVKLTTDSKTEMCFSNGSSVKVGTSMRSGTVQILHISEFGKICARTPDKAKEIVTGALEAVQVGQTVFIESTAEGRTGYFYDFCKKAEDLQKLGRELSKMDYKMFFYAWYKDKENVLDDKVLIPNQLQSYFTELELKHKITLTNNQKAWYSQKRAILQDDIFREHPSIPEEAFMSSIEGAYFATQFTKIRKEQRIAVFPILDDIEVWTWWDLGMNDCNVIWFTQLVGHQYRFIDYYENNGEGLPHYARILKEKGYVYGKHIAPHDIGVKEIGTGKTRKDTAFDLGIKFETVPRTKDLRNDIEISRNALAVCAFHEINCQQGISRLEAYRKAWDDQNGVFKDYPAHDDSSHSADAFRTFAVGKDIFMPSSKIEMEKDKIRRSSHKETLRGLAG